MTKLQLDEVQDLAQRLENFTLLDKMGNEYELHGQRRSFFIYDVKQEDTFEVGNVFLLDDGITVKFMLWEPKTGETLHSVDIVKKRITITTAVLVNEH